MEELEKLIASKRELFDVDLFHVGNTPVSAATIVVFVFILFVTLIASRLARRAMRDVLQRRKGLDPGTIAVAQRLTHYVAIAIGIGVALETIGIDLTGLFAAGAVVAVGFGFAMQNIVQNFVSGIILLLERSITPGDILEIDGSWVRVEELGIRATIVRTLNEEDVIVPNSTLIQSSVKNFTLRDDLYRVRVHVGVAYESDLRQVMDVLIAAATSVEGREKQRDPVVLLWEFGDSSVVFDVSIWIHNPFTSMTGRSHLNQAIWWALQEAEITIAFPQLDVHFDPPALSSITGSQATSQSPAA